MVYPSAASKINPMKKFLTLILLSFSLVQCNGPQKESSPSVSSEQKKEVTPTQESESASVAPCVGHQDCIVEVRKLVRGAGWEIANEQYDGEGIFYIDAFQYGTDNLIHVSYQMDCNCKPIDIKINPGMGGSVGGSTGTFHRCGDKWDGKTLYEGGIYGNYCSEKCYAMNYPN